MDTARGEFAFKIFITSFKGFNNPLQREHFNENYMETSQFPFATYAGKIIENINYARNGTYTVRTKGKMTIHGITQERIIIAEIIILNGNVKIKAGFSVLLSDYGIKIPKIVGNNLAKEIKVKVTGDLIPQS
jgi:polyisoprenoid-binding protein YceI